jgi:DNA-binding protein H-NS
MAIDIKALDHTQLGDLIKQAEARQGELARRKLQKLRDKISALVRAEGLDFNDVVGARKSTSGGTRSKVKPKYRNPADPSQTWSGRGRQPRWFAAALSGGKTERHLLIR